MHIDRYTMMYRALGDSTRLRIVKMLARGDKCACNLLEKFEITQPTLSHHMRILCTAGLVSARKDGKWSHYSINDNALEQLQAFVTTLQKSRRVHADACPAQAGEK